jgi:hypothetical protein
VALADNACMAVRERPVLCSLWTIVSLAFAFFILTDNLGYAAWNGVNFVMCLYLLLSAAAFLGLFAGLRAAVSQRRLSAWVTCVSALVIAGLSALFACSFIFSRTPGVPLSYPIFIGSFHAPLILLYWLAFFCCVTEALLFLPKTRKRKQH